MSAGGGPPSRQSSLSGWGGEGSLPPVSRNSSQNSMSEPAKRPTDGYKKFRLTQGTQLKGTDSTTGIRENIFLEAGTICEKINSPNGWPTRPSFGSQTLLVKCKVGDKEYTGITLLDNEMGDLFIGVGAGGRRKARKTRRKLRRHK